MSKHEATHTLGPEHATKGWFYCSDCHFVVCGSCSSWDCVCEMTSQEVQERADKRMMRGGRTKDAPSLVDVVIPPERKVLSEDKYEDESPEGDTRPQEGHEIMATETKKKSTKKKTEKVDPAADKRRNAEARRGKGELENEVLEVIEDFEAGNIELPEDKTLTPHRIAVIIGEKSDKEQPSGGAVAAIVKRWDTYGFALTHDKPFAFRRLSAAGKKQGLTDLKEKHRAKAKAAKAEAKAAKAAESEGE